MRAALGLSLPTPGPSIESVAGPGALGADELLVRIEACGICGTDLHILAGESYRPELPFVLGHEAVGVVVAAGDGADSRWIGRRTTMTLFEGDGTCLECLAGRERLCPNLRAVRGVL